MKLLISDLIVRVKLFLKFYLVVGKFDALPLDAFPFVFFLFHFEHVTNEKLLQIFICEIDAELLERIFSEIFKAKNIQ